VTGPLTVDEVFTRINHILADGQIPEGWQLAVQRPPGYGPPDDLIITLRTTGPAGGTIFASTLLRPPHTIHSINDVVRRLATDVRRRLT
jgi:hypothetical protein